MIEFKNVSKEFVQGSRVVEVIKDLNCNIPLEGVTAILGKSGSGKSTILSLLGGLDKPTNGSITIADKKISNLSEKELTSYRASNIGIVFQSFNLVTSLTALENVMLPLEINNISNAKDKALQVLDTVGLSDRVNHFPNELSGGESQRVAIARAISINPKIILADEPSGNLDSETGRFVMETLFKTARDLGQTLILITHDFDLASKCDLILELKNNKLSQYARN